MEHKILPTYIGLRLIQFIYAVIIKSPSGSGHKSHFEQLKQRQETACLTICPNGRLTQQRYCHLLFFFKVDQCCSFQIVIQAQAQGHPTQWAELWFSC